MGDLRDQLRKAKLLSDKEAKRIAHEERVRRKEAGREQLDKQDAERRAALEQQRAQDRDRDREREKERRAADEVAAERVACAQILADARTAGSGRNRWHFELEDGRIPRVEVSDEESRALSAGHLAIVRKGPGDAHVYGLVAVPLAVRVRAVLPDRVAWLPPRS